MTLVHVTQTEESNQSDNSPPSSGVNQSEAGP